MDRHIPLVISNGDPFTRGFHLGSSEKERVIHTITAYMDILHIHQVYITKPFFHMLNVLCHQLLNMRPTYSKRCEVLLKEPGAIFARLWLSMPEQS